MRLKTIIRSFAAAVCVALGVMPVAARADAGLVLFQDSNFGGRGIGITSDTPSLSRVNFNDLASSVHVKSGVWQLCDDANFGGRCITVDRDVRDLGQLGFNDRVSSVRRVDVRRGEDRGFGRGGFGGRDRSDWDGRDQGDITVYLDDNFSGPSRVFRDDVSDLRPTGLNDRISSVSVRRGAWLLCEHAEFRGRCFTVRGDVPSLGKFGFNDNISSMRRVR